MKKILSLLLAFTIVFSFCGCQGNFGGVNLKEAIAIPENGIIEKDIIAQIQSENAIGIFTGKDGAYAYEWTVFGSDIQEVKDVNFAAEISETAEGNVKVTLRQDKAFGFTALLSVTLSTQWNAQSATAYAEGDAFSSVSITGSQATILNLSLDGSVASFEIRPDPLSEDYVADTVPPETLPLPTETQTDDYLSKTETGDDKVYTGTKDKYNTDPIPEGKPHPVEPEDQQVNKGNSLTCTFSIECATILNNLSMLDPEKLEMVPSGGVILAKTAVTFYEGESVYDVLLRLCKEKGIHMEASWTPIYNSAYVEGIHNLYEFDCGALSGWMYRVNGWYPNYGSSRYQLKDGDLVEWRYTCDLGQDIGGAYAVGG